MAKIGDLLLEAQSVSLSDLACELAFYAKLGSLIGRDSHVARRRFERYGAGIYTRSGWYAYSEATRDRVSQKLGMIVIVTEDMRISVYSYRNVSRKSQRLERKRKSEANRAQILEEARKRKSERITMRIFEDCMTVPCKKRSGRANSHGDIGFYAYVPETRIPEPSGIAMTKNSQVIPIR